MENVLGSECPSDVHLPKVSKKKKRAVPFIANRGILSHFRTTRESFSLRIRYF
jgi:hypothetical protein